MFKAHSISDDLLELIQKELKQQKYWIAYNTRSYSLGKCDVYCFKDKHEANDFALDNYGDYDAYNVIYAKSISEVETKIVYGKAFHTGAGSDPDANGLYNPDGNTFTDALIDHFEKQQLLNTQKTNVMNQKNFEYLRDQVKFTGFGEGLENELKEKLQKQTPQFLLYHQGSFGKDETVSTLHFRKSDQSDMYFFNKYDLTLKQENKPEIMNQTFYLNKEHNITLKEAYNLMNGRAVNKDLTNKEGQVYNAWVQMDFKQTDNNGNYKLKQFHQNYGYDLNAALAKHPIKELGNEQDKTRLLESLQKGNRQSVTFGQNGSEQKQHIEANPQFKSINIYDSNMQRLGSRQSKEEKQTQGESNSVKQDAKKQGQSQGSDDDSPEIPKASNKRKKKQGQSVS